MRAWMAAVAAVAVVALAAGCGEAKKGPKDEASACMAAVNDAAGHADNLSSRIETARDVLKVDASDTTHFQAMADAQGYVKDWLVKIKALLDKDISPELRQTLTESQATLEEVQKSLDDAWSRPPDSSGKIAVINSNINRVCKGKY